ncbi:MAG: hypothetical protein C6W55_11295 [Thermobacillus sp.]|uniref:condensation domain-containing protein n=1 Tax=Thermobacillus sp. TaxID=2108467 RepID=UPI000E3AAEC8|nr:condensation domain-containing protein [Thermobacillus sp.]REK54651.1 MAG: hypothetical protein C6W55_11295 [Thermobacillus sp.]
MIGLTVRKVSMTEMQKGIFLDCQIGNPDAYYIAATIRIRNLDEALLEQALTLLIHEQAALRCCVDFVDDLPGLAVHREVEVPLVKYDLAPEQENREARARNIIEQEMSRPFDLFRPPLFRAVLVRLDKQTHLLMICIHHLAADGLSLNILARKWFDYYDALASGRLIALRQDDGFIEFILQEIERLNNGNCHEHRQYWVDKMRGAEPLALQPDYPASQWMQGVGREMRFPVSSNLFKRLQERAAELETTGFMFVMAAFALLLHQYTRQEDIVYASPFTYRPDICLEETIGCFEWFTRLKRGLPEGRKSSVFLISEVMRIRSSIWRTNWTTAMSYGL